MKQINRNIMLCGGHERKANSGAPTTKDPRSAHHTIIQEKSAMILPISILTVNGRRT